ncbi:amino acid adenylation protein [Actinophytocola xinjiangensis]|uniref:Amino acid adenylation protein n=1 Tax=Actinophytocola xinjiangensis TaxID=485602 RepID=A0A7Z0WJL9_9PSEU|nr:amino acid adenylation domain-containing protein [Actinophytocola xinjiangensis]OLF08827.1 amino acid adenylation protein [Actinophytocola xinjiangensis]
MELVEHSDSVGRETAGEPRAGKSLGDLFLDEVRRQPDRIAVVRDGESLTYRELGERAAGVAAQLRELGLRADDRIGLFVEPSVELMVGAWGILLAGGAYLPLSPEYPEERLRYMIEDARVTIVLAQEELTGRVAELAPAGTTVLTPGDGPPGAPPTVSDRDLAYVIYTSGSTGKPKGVMIEHRSVVSQLRWLSDTHGLGAGTVVLQKTPMSFDAAQWEILAPARGATVVMGSPGVYRDPERLIETIRAHGVTAIQCVPTLLQALLDTEEFTEATSLTQIFSGGEALSRTLATQCLDALPWCDLINLYGPTECTINSSAHVVDPATVAQGPLTVSIGAPVTGTTYAVLDAQQRPVSVGEVGELHIGGIQLARGYLHRPDLTAERFVDITVPGTGHTRWFRSGDLVSWNADGTVGFVGRADNQVKLRGFRVELDEIRLAIEEHDWVRNAAVIVRQDERSGFQNLIACIELNPKEAALMDQGNHGAHHQSKDNKLAVRTQLSNPGRRTAEDLAGRPSVELPGRDATALQRRWVFQRKTYRFFEGGPVSRDDVVGLLGRRPAGSESREVSSLTFEGFGEIMRSFGDCISGERLLPKYAYASPGSLYATQLYVEVNGIGGLDPGFYYYHPGDHRLVLITPTAAAGQPYVRAHFLGKRGAIEPVYSNNIQEVLEIETGHMVGLFEEYLPLFGLTLREREFTPAVRNDLDCAEDDFYLGSFEFAPYERNRPDDDLDLYVQVHPGKVADLPAGHYHFHGGELTRISDELVQKKHVIAINQHVYDRSSIGVTVISRTGHDWLNYIDLGRILQRLQMNELNLGFMSCGYSSKTGYDLPAAKRIRAILTESGHTDGPSYFFVGGRVSDEQIFDRGMREDVVHMKGPAEMVRDDLVNFLPDYMIPNKVVVFDRLPLTANGKIDVRELEASPRTEVNSKDRPFAAPRTNTEHRVCALWKKVLKLETVSVNDDFFSCGGNSLVAVRLVKELNKEFGGALPLQVLFESSTAEKLARRIDEDAEAASRLVPLCSGGPGEHRPVYCWPGLGGYTMNLRLLAGSVELDRPVYGVQAHGINPGEVPYPTIREMAAQDVRMIRERQPHGPYTLWGYSFGARVAFESAYQLERAGQRVDNLFLIAPGSPKLRESGDGSHGYANRAFLTILFSVFAGTIEGPVLARCLESVTDDESFTAFVTSRFPELDGDVVARIVAIVRQTHEFTYSFHELAQRRIDAPITVFRASGDDYSFLENSSGYSATAPLFVDLAADHYSLLKEAGIGELVGLIRSRLGADQHDQHDQAA